jgi:hypoxanthine phosphoribosyltransferase
MEAKRYFSWPLYERYVFNLAKKIHRANINPDYFIGLATGGVIGALMLRNLFNSVFETKLHVAFWSAKHWENDQCAPDLILAAEMTFTAPPPKSGTILLFDDTTDTGITLRDSKKRLQKELPDAEIITGTIWYKTSSSKIIIPDFYEELVEPLEDGSYPWIVQPFEADSWKLHMRQLGKIFTE